MYVSYKCCTAIQETRIPSEMCAGETCVSDGIETRIPSDIFYFIIYLAAVTYNQVQPLRINYLAS